MGVTENNTKTSNIWMYNIYILIGLILFMHDFMIVSDNLDSVILHIDR